MQLTNHTVSGDESWAFFFSFNSQVTLRRGGEETKKPRYQQSLSMTDDNIAILC